MFVSQTCSVRDLHTDCVCVGAGGDSPLREEGIDDSVSQRIDGQLGDPLEIFSAADKMDEPNQLCSFKSHNVKKTIIRISWKHI